MNRVESQLPPMKTYDKRCFAAGLMAAVTLLCCPVAFKASAQIASPTNYLAPVIAQMQVQWPKNRTVNIVVHGHSVPSGYFKTPAVDSLHAYPNLLRVALAGKYTNAVIIANYIDIYTLCGRLGT